MTRLNRMILLPKTSGPHAINSTDSRILCGRADLHRPGMEARFGGEFRFPQHIHSRRFADLAMSGRDLPRKAQIAQQLFHKAQKLAASISGLFHCRAAGLTQARLVALQADRNCAHVGDFASAQAVDVRCAGATLLGGADRKR
jgi:hypothetical protein